jgi:hypothetical protein
VGTTLDPGQYASAAARDLLEAAAKGYIGLDRRLLHALVDYPARSLPDLLRFAMEKRPDDRVLLEEDLISIFRHLKTPEALPFFVELVRRQPFDIPDELVEAFSLFPERSSELLLGLYRELGEKEGVEVAFLLASLRVRDPRIFDILVSRLESDPADAAFCLGLYGDPAAKPELERSLAALDDGGERAQWVRGSVEQAIADIDLPEPRVEHPVFDIWDQYLDQAGPQFSILSEAERLDFLSSPSAEVRAAAAESFFDEELSEAAGDRLLDTARRDQDAAVRARAWDALAGAVDRPEIRESMLARLASQDAPLEERCGALLGLATEAGDPDVRRWIIDFYGIPAARAKALETMCRSLDRRFAPYFPAHLDDPDPEVRRRALWGVGYLAIHAEAGRIRAFFGDREFREDALFAYTLAVPAEVSRGRARALLRKVDFDAKGLSPAEVEMVQSAIDERLARLGLDPVFASEQDEEPAQIEEELGRNDPCRCGSGKKFKKCCGA